MEALKNFILWPLIAVTSAILSYLVLLYFIAQILSFSDFFSEESLWKLVVNELPYQHQDHKKQIDLQNLYNKLPNTKLEEYKVKIIVLTSDEVNAFAAPGNRVIITTGLLDQNLSEEALLFIIGHEIAHLRRKDNIYEIAKLIASKLYGFVFNSEILSELLSQIDNSKLKKTEYLADKFAVEFLIKNNYSPKGAFDFFNYIENLGSYSQSDTHPGANERLLEIKKKFSY